MGRSKALLASSARAPWGISAFLGAMLSVSAGLSDEVRVDGVAIFDRGVFQASGGTSVAESSLGAVTNLRNVSLVQSTVTIRARDNLCGSVSAMRSRAPRPAPPLRCDL